MGDRLEEEQQHSGAISLSTAAAVAEEQWNKLFRIFYELQ